METVESSDFRLACPQCGRELELPMAANGKVAQCPACQHQFLATVLDHVASNVVSQQMATLQAFKAVTIETVVHRAQLVFSRRRKRLTWPCAWTLLMLFMLVAIPVLYFGEMYNTNTFAAIVWMVCLSPLFFSLIVYAIWFALKRSEWVCDLDANAARALKTTRAPRSLWLADYIAFLKLAAVTFVLLLCLPIVLVVAFSMVLNLLRQLFASQAIELVMVLGFVAALFLAALYAIVLARLWPVIPMSLSHSPVIQDINRAMEMTKSNLLTSFLIVVITSLLLGLGFGLFCLPLVFTAPAAALLLVVAYRSIEDRPIPVLDPAPEEFDQFDT